MNRFFDMDSSIMRFLNRVADIVWLNILTIICCIPVITAGASLTALHYVALRMTRNEEGYITKDFLKSFKENFLQATVIWMAMLVLAAGLAADFYIMAFSSVEIGPVVQILVFAAAFLLLFGGIYIFPFQARFENTIRNTVKNAYITSIMNFPKTILILIMYGVFLAAYCLFFLYLVPLLIFCGISLPVFLACTFYTSIFKKLEEQISQSV